ncbi:MAG: BON domain-containing protein [Gammaproteobacteria bacterium]|nr:BON domain-containing protein [Gammaproteobacteria bacterium]MBU1645110.1 BON domain-containing protein [Gammaproteobacteria bacterium]MBU1973347.1 BON domain-containing protein [Gammaproteobacteria bacterium]
MKNSDNFKLMAIATLVAVGLTACDKPGPAETAGKKIDQTAENAGKAIGDTVDKLGDKLNEQGAKTGAAMGDAGKSIGEAAGRVGDKMVDQNDKAAVAIDDAEITTRVKAAIFAEPGLRTLQISVDTIKGVVTLTGSVDSPANKERAKALAGAVAGVTDVRNLLVSMAAA